MLLLIIPPHSVSEILSIASIVDNKILLNLHFLLQQCDTSEEFNGLIHVITSYFVSK
jgi:hypothetical protein